METSVFNENRMVRWKKKIRRVGCGEFRWIDVRLYVQTRCSRVNVICFFFCFFSSFFPGPRGIYQACIFIHFKHGSNNTCSFRYILFVYIQRAGGGEGYDRRRTAVRINFARVFPRGQFGHGRYLQLRRIIRRGAPSLRRRRR